MKVLLYIGPPLYNNKVHGGAQQILHDLLAQLTALGHEFVIVCGRGGTAPKFNLAKGAQVFSVLNVSPSTAINPWEEAENRSVFAAILRKFDFDVCWSFDRQFPLRTGKPTVLTLGNFYYGFCLEAFYSLNWDNLVVPSTYLKDCIMAVAEKLYGPRLEERVHVVPNGIDLDLFRRTQQQSAKVAALASNNNGDVTIIYPHRPDPGKGHFEAIDLLAYAKERGKSLRLLIPKQDFFLEDVNFYCKLKDYSSRKNVSNQVVFHHWLPRELMPEYYSIADITLHTGWIPEGFGLVAVQSIACGTPVVANAVGAVRTILPAGHGLHLCPYGNLDREYKNVLCALSSNREVTKGRNFIHKKYSMLKMVEEYEEILLGTTKKEYLEARDFLPLRIVLSPWCYEDNGTIYNDYLKKEVKLSESEKILLKSIAKDSGAIPSEVKESSCFYKKRLIGLVKKGVISLIPVSTQADEAL